jgi:hypothetical protein
MASDRIAFRSARFSFVHTFLLNAAWRLTQRDIAVVRARQRGLPCVPAEFSRVTEVALRIAPGLPPPALRDSRAHRNAAKCACRVARERARGSRMLDSPFPRRTELAPASTIC